MDETPLCPRCHCRMVLRFNKKNRTKFYGCANYPNCRPKKFGTRYLTYPSYSNSTGLWDYNE